ncbi:retrotransposon protein, putative, ty1-copia subclass [Tanacetum coccineum]
MRETKSHNILGIALVAFIDRQLRVKYTIASRSTDVMVMAHPAQNINHSAFTSMFEREKLSGNNFNDWFRQLKLVLRVEKKMYVIEQPIPPTPVADSIANVLAECNAVYDAHNEVAYLMLGSMTPAELHRQFENYSPYEMLQELKSMFEKQVGVERFDVIQTFHSCKLEDGKPVGAYVLKIKDYVEQLERLGYVLPQDLSVGLILNGLTSNFAGFVRNYNMHNMGKTIGELHALLIKYEKSLPKKAATPQVMAIQGGRIQKANKKLQKAKGKDYRILVSKNDVLYFNAIPSNGIYEIDMSNLVPNVNSIYNVSNKRVKHNLDSTYLWHWRLAHISKKCIEKLQQDGLLKPTDDESFDKYVSSLSGKMTRKLFPRHPERATDLLGLIHTDVCGPLEHGRKFEVFKNEVENQLRKTIKALRSDRGGKYISQEFKVYLKACGIVQQLTPPYTPQHNGVSERRNRTLLDMVRSMMNLTTLPLSFWDNALESAARILDMVPTKKVDKTPYEL